MRSTSAAVAFALALMASSAFADRLGPEVPVTESALDQRNVVVSRDGTRTLIAFDQRKEIGGRSEVVLHRYEARLGVLLGRETFAVDPSGDRQQRPAFGSSLIAWAEEAPAGGGTSLWWQGLLATELGSGYEPVGPAERVAEVKPGTRLEVLNTHVFHVMLWTAPDGRLRSVYRSLIARIGFDPSTFYVTEEAALNPSSDSWTESTPLVAYNHEVPPEGCAGSCAPRYGIRATTLGGPSTGPRAAIDIAPAGASAPRVVADGDEFVVFWSMEHEGVFAQRVSTAGETATRVGGVVKVYDGILHDASRASNGETFLVVDRSTRFELLRIDRQGNVLARVPFQAELAEDSTISISSPSSEDAMLVYAAKRTDVPSLSRAVFRLVDDAPAPRKRRSTR